VSPGLIVTTVGFAPDLEAGFFLDLEVLAVLLRLPEEEAFRLPEDDAETVFRRVLEVERLEELLPLGGE
jgi:hypothetical protein